MMANTKINIILCLTLAGLLALIMSRVETAYRESREVNVAPRCICPAPECKCVTPPAPVPPPPKCNDCESMDKVILEIVNGSIFVPRRGTDTITVLTVDLTRVAGTGVVVENGIKSSAFGVCTPGKDNGICEIQEKDLSPAGNLATRLLRACR